MDVVVPSAQPQNQPWADFSSVFTNAKAGMDCVDKEHVKRVVYEMSKDSAHFKHEQHKQAHADARIAKLLERNAKLTTAELAAHVRAMDSKIVGLEASRDLSRTWLVVDMDAFFASVEELDNPALKLVPMAVGGMGMISTTNYLARKFGVRSAMPGFIGVKLCPQLVFAKPNFSRYQAVAQLARDIFRAFDPDFSSMGLDEASLDVTAYCEEHNMTGSQVGDELRRRIREELHLTCSCGIAPNRMLAKVCSDIKKPDGQYVLPNLREAVLHFVGTLPIRKVPGVGKVTERTLNALGITQCAHLLQRRGVLAALFSTITCDFFLSSALGLGATRHEAPGTSNGDGAAGGDGEPGRKGISCERTFRNMSERGQLEEMAKKLTEHLCADMASETIEGRCITLKLKLSNFEVRTRSVTMPTHVSGASEILPVLLRLLRAELPLELRLMGVRMSMLRSRRPAAGGGQIAKWLLMGNGAAAPASTSGTAEGGAAGGAAVQPSLAAAHGPAVSAAAPAAAEIVVQDQPVHARYAASSMQQAPWGSEQQPHEAAYQSRVSAGQAALHPTASPARQGVPHLALASPSREHRLLAAHPPDTAATFSPVTAWRLDVSMSSGDDSAGCSPSGSRGNDADCIADAVRWASSVVGDASDAPAASAQPHAIGQRDVSCLMLPPSALRPSSSGAAGAARFESAALDRSGGRDVNNTAAENVGAGSLVAPGEGDIISTAADNSGFYGAGVTGVPGGPGEPATGAGMSARDGGAHDAGVAGVSGRHRGMYQPPLQQQQQQQQQPQHQGSNPREARSTWACSVCTYAGNHRLFLRCEMCDSLRHATSSSRTPDTSDALAGTSSHLSTAGLQAQQQRQSGSAPRAVTDGWGESAARASLSFAAGGNGRSSVGAVGAAGQKGRRHQAQLPWAKARRGST